jgi:hypothetical protein
MIAHKVFVPGCVDGRGSVPGMSKRFFSSPQCAAGPWSRPLNQDQEWWSYISTPTYVFMAWDLIKHRDDFATLPSIKTYAGRENLVVSFCLPMINKPSMYIFCLYYLFMQRILWEKLGGWDGHTDWRAFGHFMCWLVYRICRSHDCNVWSIVISVRCDIGMEYGLLQHSDFNKFIILLACCGWPLASVVIRITWNVFKWK